MGYSLNNNNPDSYSNTIHTNGLSYAGDSTSLNWINIANRLAFKPSKRPYLYIDYIRNFTGVM